MWLLFDKFDPGWTGCPVEVRYPYFDVRLVKYLLGIPPLPWCVDKELLRAALPDQVPDAVRLRPKTPLPEFPFLAYLRQHGVASLGRPSLVPLLARYATPEDLTPLTGKENFNMLALKLLPRKLNAWLRSVSPQCH
jgi:asparagine synthase (glutamine-hydrolysing)